MEFRGPAYIRSLWSCSGISFLIFSMLILSAAGFYSIFFGSCVSPQIGMRERIGPVIVEYPAEEKLETDVEIGTEESRSGVPPYNIFSMVHALHEGMFTRLGLEETLSLEEKLELILRCFSRLGRPNQANPIRFRFPDYFERGDLVIYISHQQEPPERLEWTSNAVVNPLTGEALKGRGKFIESSGVLRNAGESLLIQGDHIIREQHMYSRERELKLIAGGELLLLAHADLFDEREYSDRRGKMIIEGVLTTPDQPSERVAAALCIQTRYHLKNNEYSQARLVLEEASKLCLDGPSHLHALYKKIEQEYRLSKALFER